MLNDDDRHIPVRLCMGGPAKFAKGGLVHAAQAVNDAGRFGDDMVVHLNRREFEELRSRWGEPHVNPETGLPEFWNLKDLWHDVKDYVAPVGAAAAGAFLPGIGEALGGMFPGLASTLGSTGTQALATGLLGAGAGALLNGGQGALMGGLGGVLGAYGGDLLQNGMGSALGTAAAGAAGAGASGAAAAGSGAGAAAEGAGGASGLFGGGSSRLGTAALMAALNLAGSAMDNGGEGKSEKKSFKKAQAQFDAPLPVYVNPRKRSVYNGVPDFTQQGEQTYFDNNHFADGGKVEDRLPDAENPFYRDPPYNPDSARADLGIDPMSWIGYLLSVQRDYPEVAGGKSDLEGYADGGRIMDGHDGYIPNTTGDTGRSDKINANVSPNEYIVDAETTALLGDGSPEAGAKRLDEMRAAVRAHKGSALAQGQISPDALHPLQYLGMN